MARKTAENPVMHFRNACFISYRHPKQRFGQKIVESFHADLQDRLDARGLDAPVYFDKLRLKGGDFWEPSLANDLCNSACMILLFNNYYFDAERIYCAREYFGMVELERKRLRFLSDDMIYKGLIIPVFFYGAADVMDVMPLDLKKRQCYSFADELLNFSFNRRNTYVKKIEKIAEDIFKRYLFFEERINYDLSKHCKSFKFPTEKKVKELLRRYNIKVYHQSPPRT